MAVYWELREIYRDHLGEEDVTIQMVVLECDTNRLYFAPRQLAAYIDQIRKGTFPSWNSYLLVETYDHEAYFVRREGKRLIVIVPPDNEKLAYDWELLHNEIVATLKEEGV